MALELYIEDKCSLSERLAIEARAAMQAGLPKGLDVNPRLIEQANGYSSRCEMLKKFKELGVEHCRTGDYDSIRIPEGSLDATKMLITKSGYVIKTT